MPKLKNNLNVNVKALDSGVDNKDLFKVHQTLNNLRQTPTASVLAGKMPEIHVVGNSFPKIGYKDYHIDPVQNKVIIWHPSGDKIPVEKKIHDSLSRLALSSIITKVAPEAPKAPPVKENTNANKPISGDILASRQNNAEGMKKQRRDIIQKHLVNVSKEMWANKAHLPPAIKRRLLKNPKEGVAPQALSLLHKLIGKRMIEKSGDPKIIIQKAIREAKTPEAKALYNKFLPLVEKIINWGHRI